MESKRSDVDGAGEVAGGFDGTAELRPARAMAVILVVVVGGLLSVMPAAIALGVARLELEQLATGLTGLAASVGGVKLLVAASGVAGRLWSEHTARLATAQAG
ncbi:MAG: hypothetical protein WCC30_05780 [Candidatus Dormiibacterota bacterium]